MQIVITIQTDNAAFADGNAGVETARILRDAAKRVEEWEGGNTVSLTLRDYNGNAVGKMESRAE